jgi:hypothetical protein
VIIGQYIAFGGIDDDPGAQTFKRLSLLLRRIVAKTFSTLPACFARGGGPFNLYAHDRRQHFFQHRRRLGNAPWPGTCVGNDAVAGGKTDNDNPMLNANALNSKVCFFIRCWLS